MIQHSVAHNTVPKWRAAQMICELLQVYLRSPREELKEVAVVLIKQLRTLMRDRVELVGKFLGSQFLKCLDAHKNQEKCESCHLPASLDEDTIKSTTVADSYINQWPKQKAFSVFPFLSQEAEEIRFTFPTSRFLITRKHVTADSPSALLKTTKLRRKKTASKI